MTALVDGEVSEAERASVEAHVAECAACRRLVSGAMASLPPAPEQDAPGAPTALERGAHVGRYLVLSVLGAGSMGVVYSAYDPDLDRRVAIKIVHPAGPRRPDAAGRMWREAQAMARLVHPNVVAVHDVGLIEGSVFIAMDHIEGGTLTQWLRERPRSWRQITTIFAAAGRGLAAAHAAGLVHRDFKPENVLVDAHGIARIADFGLAAGTGEAPAAAPPSAAADARLTVTGDVAGTPLYLAPERFAGEPADARSDQFSFCVALWQALYDERPFPAQDLQGLIARLTEDGGPAPPARRRGPARLQRILARGLSRQRERRYPSMDHLLADLTREPGRWGAGVALGVVALAGGAWAYHAWSTQPAWCGSMETAFGDTWDEPHREATRAAFVRVAGASAAPSFARVDRALTGWRTAWIAQRVDACEASHVRHEQSDEMLDLRVACLDDALRVTAAFARLLPDADAALVDHAVVTVERLPDARSCANRELLRARREPPPAPESRAAVALAEADLATGTALVLAGNNPSAAKQLARHAADVAQALGRTRLLARALLLQASVEGDAVLGPDLLAHAAAAALEARDDEALADAFIALAHWHGKNGNSGEVEVAAGLARAAIVRLGGDDVREAERLIELARGYDRFATDLGRGAQYAEEARRTLVAAGRGGDIRVIYVDETLAINAYWQARYEDAYARFGRVAEALARIRGPLHPDVIREKANQAEMLIDMGRPAEALPILSALTDVQPEFGSVPRVARALALRALGRFREARAEDQGNLEQCRQSRGPGCLPVQLLAVAEDLVGLGLPVEARPVLEEAVVSLVGSESAPVLVATIKLALARVLPPVNRGRAEQLANEALVAITPWAERYGGPYAKLRKDILAWLGR